MARSVRYVLLALLLGCGGSCPPAQTASSNANDADEAPPDEARAPVRSVVDELRELLANLDHEPTAASVARIRGARYADRDVEQARLDCLETVTAMREQQEPGDVATRCRARITMLMQIHPDAAPLSSTPVTPGTGPTDAPPPPADFAPSAAPRDITGALTDDDPRVPDDDSPYDEYPVDLEAGWTITVDMRSAELDTYLWLIGPAGSSLVQDDDGGEGTNSHFTFRAGASGRYIVRANSYDGSGRGAYELQIRVQR